MEDPLIPTQSGLDQKTKLWVREELASSWALAAPPWSACLAAGPSRPTLWDRSTRPPKEL